MLVSDLGAVDKTRWRKMLLCLYNISACCIAIGRLSFFSVTSGVGRSLVTHVEQEKSLCEWR